MKARRNRIDLRSVPVAPSKKASECPHPERKLWARGRCKSCYDKWLREKNIEYAAAQRKNVAAWRESNRERYLEGAREYSRSLTPEQRRRQTLLARYGLTPDDYEVLLATQGGRCAICLREPKPNRPLQVDHCHESGNVRGLLCFRCNYGLSFFSDDAARMKRASVYLERGGR